MIQYKISIYNEEWEEVDTYTAPSSSTFINRPIESFEDIVPGGRYYIVVTAVNSHGATAPSKPYEVIASGEYLIPLKAARYKDEDGSWWVRLTWSGIPTSHVDSVVLHKNTYSDEYKKERIIFLSPYYDSYIDLDLEPGYRYKYELEVRLDNGETIFSEPVWVEIPEERLSSSYVLTVIIISVIITAVVIAW